MTDPEAQEYSWNLLARLQHTSFGDIRAGLHHMGLWSRYGWSPEAMQSSPAECGCSPVWTVSQLWNLWRQGWAEYLPQLRGDDSLA